MADKNEMKIEIIFLNWKWIPKLENKHHIAKECVYHKNKQFHASEVEVLLSHTLTSNDTAFLAARLN